MKEIAIVSVRSKADFFFDKAFPNNKMSRSIKYILGLPKDWWALRLRAQRENGTFYFLETPKRSLMALLENKMPSPKGKPVKRTWSTRLHSEDSPYQIYFELDFGLRL